MSGYIPSYLELGRVLAAYIPPDLSEDERRLRKANVRSLYVAHGSPQPYWSAVPYKQKAACFEALKALAGVK